jgi:membrane protein implicated in regulation of membrane protease activity
MSAAVIWFIAGIVLLGAEALTGTFVLLMLGAGALAAATSALFSPSPFVDALVFATVSALLLVAVRPRLGRHTPAALECDGSPVGGSGLVVRRVDADSGQIKIDGELWSARSLERDRVFEPGERVTVMQLSGVTAVVSAEI